jgi:hypothetical protein
MGNHPQQSNRRGASPRTSHRPQDGRQLEGAQFRPQSADGAHNSRAERLLTAREEAVIVAYRSRTRLSLDNCLEKLRELIPTLTRSTLYWCLRRYGLNKIGPTAKTARTNEDVFEGPYCFDITLDLIPLPMARSTTTSRLRSSRRPTGARLLISTSKMSVSCAGRISFSWRSSRRPIGSYADVFDHPSPTTQRSFCAISSRRCPRRSILWRPQDRLSSGPGASISRMI